MPLPTPKGESQQEFMARCMEELKSEFPDREQRVAVCYTQWRGEWPLFFLSEIFL